jgi:hypothetical protein
VFATQAVVYAVATLGAAIATPVANLRHAGGSKPNPGRQTMYAPAVLTRRSASRQLGVILID